MGYKVLTASNCKLCTLKTKLEFMSDLSVGNLLGYKKQGTAKYINIYDIHFIVHPDIELQN